MDKFNIAIFQDVFEKIQTNSASYIILLNSAKYKQLKIGNMLTLENMADKTQISVKVNDLLYFENIKDLFMMVGKGNCGYTQNANVDQIEDKYVQLYKDEKISEYGLMAVKIEKV